MANDISLSIAEQRQQVFMQLYKKAFPGVARYVARLGGSFDEAKDVFQDALVIYYERCIAKKVEPDNPAAYLMGTAKNLWLKGYQQNNKFTSLDLVGALPEEEHEQPSDRKLLRFLQTAGKKCMDLLKSFYYDEQPLNEIAEACGYSGVRSATVQKYKCLEKVRETIKQKALTYDDFMA